MVILLFQLGPPPLPLLLDPRIDANGNKSSVVKQTGMSNLVAHVTSSVHEGERLKEAKSSSQDMFPRLSHAFISQDESENDANETEMLYR
jgi:hypothetical protein